MMTTANKSTIIKLPLAFSLCRFGFHKQVCCGRSGLCKEIWSQRWNSSSSAEALKGCIRLTGVVIFKNEQVSPHDHFYAELHMEIDWVINFFCFEPFLIGTISSGHWHLSVRIKAFVNLLMSFGSMISDVCIKEEKHETEEEEKWQKKTDFTCQSQYISANENRRFWDSGGVLKSEIITQVMWLYLWKHKRLTERLCRKLW